MAKTPEASKLIRDLRSRMQAEGGLFWADESKLCVFDPEAAQRVNTLNYEDLTLPDRLVDLLRRRESPKVSWKEIRAVWIEKLRHLSNAEGIAQLDRRMAALFDERLDQPIDLMWAAQEITSRSLVPSVIDGLPPADQERVQRDQTLKLQNLLVTEAPPDSLWEDLRSIWAQIGAGRAARRELAGRAKGRRPRRLDMADPLVDMLPELGMDRAADALTAVLTAIAGPPGATSACLFLEWIRHPEWADRLRRELEPLKPGDLAGPPGRIAPLTHRFVKEVLRMWGPPLLMTRPVRTGINLGKERLDVGQSYLLSPFFIHHDPRHWKDPEVFDPDRWLPGAENGPCPGKAAYVPFGWAPKSCLGAGLGTAQLMLLCHLLSTRYRIAPEDPEAIRVFLSGVPLVLDFRGQITRV